jgi:hypothetical membrane protein
LTLRPPSGATAIDRRQIAGSVLWICCAQFFVVEAISARAWAPAYSYARNYISDLGAVHCAVFPPGTAMLVCSPLHALMNASFALQGALIAGGALLLLPILARDRLAAAGLALIALAGAGVFAVGLAPEDAHIVVHLLGAAANIVGGNVGMIAVGIGLRGAPHLRTIAVAAIAAGLIGLIAGQLLVGRTDLGLGIGGIERVAIYPLPLWLAFAGASLVRVRPR